MLWIPSEISRDRLPRYGGGTAGAFVGDPRAWMILGDLMIAELVMDRLDGRWIRRLARRTRPDLNVLLCSGYYDDMCGSRKTSANEHVRKPVQARDPGRTALIALQRAAQGAVDNVVRLRAA